MSDEGRTLNTSALGTFYSGHFTLSTQFKDQIILYTFEGNLHVYVRLYVFQSLQESSLFTPQLFF